ncbi:MAG: CoA-disulfide reductase, partial [Planctomycetaceae bacterium]|nr:CoA-disulfide reductase [Planctomycetaceae bacterium]
RGVQCTAILGCFGMSAAVTGFGEKMLRQRGTPFASVTIHPANHAGYYPGAQQMTLKLLFDRTTGRILGAQGIGGNGVDKRIDVLAVAIQAGMKVYDLEEMELAYAPQFGSAKDPVNMLGFVASGMLRGDHPQITMADYLALPESERGTLVDVRTPTEFTNGALPGAVNIPVDELRQRLGELPQGSPVYVYCQVGMRGYLATRILLQKGFSVHNLSGGYRSYTQFLG